MLSFQRSLNPGHVLMFSAPREDFASDELRPVLVRDECVRGLNATSKTENAKRSEAVLQIVESAELGYGHEYLVLRTRFMVTNSFHAPHSCNEPKFLASHREKLAELVAEGLLSELARRYALTIAAGEWAWRNAMEAESVQVRVVLPAGKTLVFADLLLARENTFAFDNPEYAKYKDALDELAAVLEAALSSKSVRGKGLRITAVLRMGPGARVYPSQEWASFEAKERSKKRWPDSVHGVSRFLAKLPADDGKSQAIITDRKMGNRIRVIDDWHGNAELGAIAVELFGANSHAAAALRTDAQKSFFGIADRILNNEPVTPEQKLFYFAACIRGGVFGA